MKHPLAHILEAMAEGKKIQARAIRPNMAGASWFDIDEDGEIHPLVAQNLLMNNHPDAPKKHEFRIAGAIPEGATAVRVPEHLEKSLQDFLEADDDGK